MTGILNGALAGLARLRAAGYEFPETSESQRLKAEYRQSQDTTAQFLSLFTEVDLARRDWHLDSGRLYSAYSEFCRQSGYLPLNDQAFGMRLNKLGLPPARRVREGDRMARWRDGIRFLRAEEDGLLLS